MKKRGLSLFLTVLMLLCSIPLGNYDLSLFNIEASAANFTPRTTAPTTSNSYYYSNNIFYTSGWGMPNCTCYAYGRAYEILGSKPKLSTGNAGGWWLYNKNNGYYPYGQTPKLGAIAVWDKYNNNNGHVAVVEAISGNQVTISESHYGGTFFNTRTINSNSSNYLTSYRFLGYIYIADIPNPDPHTVDSNYSKNYTAYLKNPSGKTTVYTSCGVVASGHYISGNDPVTIHEVYTDGCCKVSYTTDSGATRTYYAKIADFKPAHTHSYSKNYEAAHPHKEYMKCSCGDWYYLTTTQTLSTCSQCWNVKVGISQSSASLKIGETVTMNASLSGVWPESAKAEYIYDNSIISYTLNKGVLKITGLKKGSTDFTINIYSDYKTNPNAKLLSSATVKVSVFPYTLSVYYNANGGTISSSIYAIGTNIIYTKSTGSKFIQTWTCGESKENGLYNASTFGISKQGYNFIGWGTSSTGGTIFNQNDNTITAEKINSNVKTTDCSSVLYAIWKANTYTVKYNANGGSGTMSNSTHTYDTAKALSTNTFTRPGYTFLGWSTSSSATTATYTDKQSVKNLTSTNNGTVTLYAVWKVTNSALSANSSYNATISTAGYTKYFKYTPSTSGNYVIYSTGNTDTRVYLYNISGTQLASNDDSGAGQNFRLQYNLTAGTTYIFGVRYYSSSKTGTIPFKFGKVYTITYNANGGSGVPSSQSKDYGTDLTLSSTVPTKTGYTFLGWSTNNTAANATYSAGGNFSANENTTLYAVWKQNSCSHNWKWITKTEPTCITFGEKYQKCSYCNTTRNGTVLPATGHTKVTIKGYAATCTKTGLTDGVKCSVCNTTLTAQTTIKAKGHTMATIKGYAATCTKTGLTDGVKCSVCNKILTAQTTIKAKGHTKSTVKGYAATCTKTGLTDGVKCSVCGKILTAQQTIKATGHTKAIIKGHAATCTKTGLTDGIKCSVCNEILTAQTTIKATGHTKATIKGYAATCTETGLTDSVKCSVCNEILTSQEVIPAIGHSFGKWTIVTAPTMKNEGTEERACTVCGKKETRAIAKLNYIMGDIDNNGNVTPSDARLVLRISAGLEKLDSYSVPLEAIDMNGDGKIAPADARTVLRKAAGLE